jgi:hypothetical protein
LCHATALAAFLAIINATRSCHLYIHVHREGTVSHRWHPQWSYGCAFRSLCQFIYNCMCVHVKFRNNSDNDICIPFAFMCMTPPRRLICGA